MIDIGKIGDETHWKQVLGKLSRHEKMCFWLATWARSRVSHIALNSSKQHLYLTNSHNAPVPNSANASRSTWIKCSPRNSSNRPKAIVNHRLSWRRIKKVHLESASIIGHSKKLLSRTRTRSGVWKIASIVLAILTFIQSWTPTGAISRCR